MGSVSRKAAHCGGTDCARDIIRILCLAATELNYCALDNNGSNDNEVDANEEDGLEDEEGLVVGPEEELKGELDEEIRHVFSSADSKEIAKRL
ncbi:unnamed protein product [Heligmosomoides polygyrus]|uniref:Uncharacterized protein n=1 Tax=Heligmosomoides polygyrus TaxID=6339 RepID=A0A183GX91_HELPZ|nr:unnamed protein product [Heligmosomoides polygyrus]